MATEIITRAQARALGRSHYYTGKPCKYGHVSVRHVPTGTCLECGKMKSRAWRLTNPDKQSEQNRSRYLKNSERIKEQNSAWYAANKERAAAARRAWAKANPDKVRAHCRLKNLRRRARLQNAAGDHTAADLAAILNAQGNRCAYCRKSLRRSPMHVDHIQPLSLGGSNARDNIQCLCPRCNLSKGANDPVDYARSIGLLI